MRFNKLDLNLLVALDAMLAERNISRAAERMHMSQSAMSNALARLREYFGDELLVQVGRRMDLTPRAEALEGIVRDVLVRIDAAVVAEPTFDYAHAEREFTLFVSDYTLQTLMPHVLALSYERAPGVRFQLLPQTSDPDRVLERGEADLLVIPDGYCSTHHPTEVLFKETLCCAVWTGSKWAHTPLSEEAYRGAGHVQVLPGRDRPAVDQVALQQLGVARRIEVTTFSFASAAFLVLHTDRIVTLHWRLGEQARRHLPVTLFPVPVPVPEMKQVMQWHKYRSYDPGLVWLRGLLHEAAARMDRV